MIAFADDHFRQRFVVAQHDLFIFILNIHLLMETF